MNVTDPLFGIHGQALELRSQRLSLLASNIANAATPGFKARDLDFRKALDGIADATRYRVPVQSSLDGNTVGRVADARAVVGTRQVRLDAESVQLKDDWLALEKDVARVAGLDLPSAISRVQRLMVVLQATQASFVKVNSLSLWDRL